MESAPIDVLVLTPLPQELAALRAELGQADDEGANSDFSYVIWRRVALKERTGGGYLVAVMPLEKDQIPAGNTTHLALNRWSPRCFALMGIAGQLRAKVKLGDVVVGRHVLQWDAKRKEEAEAGGESRTEYSLTPAPSARWGANLAKLLESDTERYEEWKARCAKDRPSELEQRAPELHVEDIASGSATIDSEKMRQMLSGLSRYLYAVETEAAAALSAFHSRNSSARSILIRGVSDPSAGKSESDAEGEGAWRRYAARNAAKLLVYLLSIYQIDDQYGNVGTVQHSVSTQPRFPGTPHTPRFEGPGKQPARKVQHFMDRGDLARLRQALAGGDSTVCVVAAGIGGIGKTVLVREFVATKAKALFPDGSAWLDGMSLLEELRRVAERFGYAEDQPPSAEEATRWLANELHHRRVLLVVDNVDPKRVDLKQIPKPGGRCKTVLTSRFMTLHELLGEATRLPLDRWDGPTCRNYFHKVVPTLADSDDAGLDALREFVGGLPLAIRLLSLRLLRSGARPEEVLERLKKAPITTLDKSVELSADDKGVAATFVVSFDEQPDLSKGVLVALAACAQGTSAELVAEVTGVTKEKATDALQELAEQSLVERTGSPTMPWGLHDVVRLFVCHHQEEEFQLARSRLVAWATKYAANYTIGVWLRDHRDRFKRLHSYEADLMLAWRWANETRSLPEAISLWQNLWVYLEMAYQWEAAIQESRKTLNLLAADANKYRLIERWIEVNSLGFCQLKLGRLEEAERTLAHALDALAGDPPAGDDWGTNPLAAGMPHVLKSVAHRHLAAVYQAMMQELRDSPKDLAIIRKKAQAEAEAALSCAKQIDAHVCSKESAVNVAVSQVTLVGSLQQTAGQDVKVLERALGLLDGALKELGSIGDDWRLASAYLVKGRTLKNLERYDEAEAHLLLARSHSERIKRLDTDRNATRELLEIKEKLGDVDACNRLRDDLSQPPVWAKTN